MLRLSACAEGFDCRCLFFLLSSRRDLLLRLSLLVCLSSIANLFLQRSPSRYLFSILFPMHIRKLIRQNLIRIRLVRKRSLITMIMLRRAKRLQHTTSMMTTPHRHTPRARHLKDRIPALGKHLDQPFNLARRTGHLKHHRLRRQVDHTRLEDGSQFKDLRPRLRPRRNLDRQSSRMTASERPTSSTSTVISSLYSEARIRCAA